MAAENCSSSLLLDPFSWSGGRWGPSTTDLHAFETEALARALGASMLPNPAASSAVDTAPSSSSRSSTFFPCSPSPTASNASTFTATPASSAGSPFPPSRSASPRPTPPPIRPRPGVAATGGISKRKPRRSPPSSSKRTPIAFIETDPASFREMVQQMTGFGMPPPMPAPAPMYPYQPTVSMMQMIGSQQMRQSPATQVLAAMPTLDTSAGLIDTVAVPAQHQQEQILSAPGVLDLDNSFALFLADFDCASDMLMNMSDFPQQQQQPKPSPPCFPTLESWSD